MKAYNYTIIEEYQNKYYIPYLNIEFKGILTPIIIAAYNVCVILIIGILLSSITSYSYFIGIVISSTSSFTLYLLSTSINKKTNRSKLQEFYYINCKNYNYIIDMYGVKHYLSKRKKGKYFYVFKKN